jgi:hypothetical protein
MFTVMHEKQDGSQELFSVMSVQYLPQTFYEDGDPEVQLLCGPGEAGPGIRCGTLRKGKVFVMNREGATVARFYLDKPSAKPKAS